MASIYSRSLVPPGQHPPLAVITPTDHAAWIIISTTLGMSLSVLFAGIRVYIRASSGTEYGLDDLIAACATVVSIVQSGLVLAACKAGLGKSIEMIKPDALESVQKLYYASNLLYIICLVLSRASLAYFVRRLTPVRSQRRFLIFVLAGLALWGVVFLFVLSLVCDASHAWSMIGERCTGYFLNWAVLESIGCLFELAIVGASIWLVWTLKISPSNKVAIVAAFTFRLLLIPIAALRLDSFDRSGTQANPTLLEASFIAWTSAELHYSIVAATIPIIRPFVQNLTTHYGGRGSISEESPSNGNIDGRRASNQHDTLPLDSLRRSTHWSETKRDSQASENIFQTAEGSQAGRSSFFADEGESISTGHPRMGCIRKEVSWHVTRQ